MVLQKKILATATCTVVDFSLEKANNKGGKNFYTNFVFYVSGVPEKINHFLHFLRDYKLKIIEILYTRCGQYCSPEGPHLKQF